jgi:hypothetical protein
MFLLALFILGRLGRVGGYRAQRLNPKEKGQGQQQVVQVIDRPNGVAGGCDSI